jgi:hypothetical protein
MRELNQMEVENVSGGVIDLSKTWGTIRQIIRELPSAYQDAITSTADMMCIATSNC